MSLVNVTHVQQNSNVANPVDRVTPNTLAERWDTAVTEAYWAYDQLLDAIEVLGTALGSIAELRDEIETEGHDVRGLEHLAEDVDPEDTETVSTYLRALVDVKFPGSSEG